MNVSFDAADLKPLVAQVVVETLASAASVCAETGRLAYLEAEAAELLGLQRHQLRDERLKGRITATKVCGKWAYERAELLTYLARGRSQGNQS